MLLTVPEIASANDFCVLEYLTSGKYNISNTSYTGPFTRSDLALVSCPDRGFLLPVSALGTCFKDDTTLVCPHSVLHKMPDPDWLGLPWTLSTKLSFPRLHSASSDCSNLSPLLHLGGRHYFSTTPSDLSVSGLANTTTIHLFPLMVYHFPCKVTFPEQQTGLGSCPSRLDITVQSLPRHTSIMYPGARPWTTQYWNYTIVPSTFPHLPLSIDPHSIPLTRLSMPSTATLTIPWRKLNRISSKFGKLRSLLLTTP